MTFIHSYIHTYIHTYIHSYIHTDIQTYRHTDIQTYRHTYIHTYIQYIGFSHFASGDTKTPAANIWNNTLQSNHFSDFFLALFSAPICTSITMNTVTKPSWVAFFGDSNLLK